MSTFLELCVDVRRECRVGQSGPSTVVNQVGQLERIVNWVADAYTEIQQRSTTWRWLRSEFSLNTVANTDTYASGSCTDTIDNAAVTRFARWLPMDDSSYANMRIYLQSAGAGSERWMTFLDWASFRQIYRIGTQNPGAPVHVSIDPRNKLVLGPKPNGVYVVTGEYQKSPQTLSADNSTPEMPEQFHNLIVYMAMRKYASGTSAPEVMSRAVTEGNSMMRALEANQLPAIQYGMPLA